MLANDNNLELWFLVERGDDTYTPVAKKQLVGGVNNVPTEGDLRESGTNKVNEGTVKKKGIAS